jgi:hypothetical protein
MRRMRWSELQERQATLGTVAGEKLISPGVVLIGTVRKDGSARVSAVEPLIMDGALWLSMMAGSAKARDLYRDPRIQLNSIITGPEATAEVKIRGTARLEQDVYVHRSYARQAADELGWRAVVGDFALFAVDIEDLTYLSFDEATGAQHVARWPANIEFVRAAISPTKLGAREYVHRLIEPP